MFPSYLARKDSSSRLTLHKTDDLTVARERFGRHHNMMKMSKNVIELVESARLLVASQV